MLTLGAQGILPTTGVAGDVTGLIFYSMVLLVAVTAAVHTLVAFRPRAELPSLPDAERARAAAKRQPVMDAEEGWAMGRRLG